MCRYGYSYFRVDDVRTAVGFVLAGDATQSSQTAKLVKRDRTILYTQNQLAATLEAIRSLPPGCLEDDEANRRQVVEEMKKNPKTLKAIADTLRKDFASQPLQQSHDFMQFVKQVRSHIVVIMQASLPGVDSVEAAEQLPHEGAIYYSCELMINKIDSLAYLDEVNRAFGGEKEFKLHPLVLKYVRIYNWLARQKKLRLSLHGESYGNVFYQASAVGVVIHALLDNMIKYAPAGSETSVDFEENTLDIKVSFTSLGPKIHEDEKTSIFQPGVRGRAAREMSSEGMGVGLASAGAIAEELRIPLTVEQSPDPSKNWPDMFQTIFSLRFDRSP